MAFENPAARFDPPTNKRTQLVDKVTVGPEERKCEEDQIEEVLDDQRPALHKQVRDLFSLMGQLVKYHYISQKKIQLHHPRARQTLS